MHMLAGIAADVFPGLSVDTVTGIATVFAVVAAVVAAAVVVLVVLIVRNKKKKTSQPSSQA